MATRALDDKYAHLVARDSEVDLAQIALRHSRPADKYALVGELACAVLVRSELGHPAATLELALVVVLLCEWKQEPFLAVQS